MGLKIWLDGKLVKREEAKVSVFDHGLLYGDGVFEGIRVYEDKIFEVEAHVRRLYESARAIRLKIKLSPTELTEAMFETVKANNITNGYIRLVVTRGVGTLGLNPFVCENSCIIIIADNIQLYPEELYEKGMKIISINPKIREILAKLGANPITMTPQDSYLALERGMAEGMAFPIEPLK